MTNELRIDHCPNCGRVYQKNLRNLCSTCTAEEDNAFRSTEVVMLRNRFFTTEELSETSSVPADRIRGWIRAGKIRLNDYPNLTDQCDLCEEPIRAGHLCLSCSKKIKEDLADTLDKERKEKERIRAANAFISKRI